MEDEFKMCLDPYKIRGDFPILSRKIYGKNLIYFDNAATTQKPRQVIDAICNYYREKNANIHRGVHMLSQEASELYEEAHYKVAKFINASQAEEIVFVKNTTEAINLVAYSWGIKNLERGDEVLTTLMEHHSNIVPWYLLTHVKGVKVKVAGIKNDGTLDMDDLKGLINEKTRLVTVVHTSNFLGTINNVKEICKVAHEAGALVLVDGAQSVPHMPVNVKEINCDFLVFSGHKMLGPTGIGVLYGKREILEETPPFMGGGDMISEVHYASGFSIKWNSLPWKFEAGTPNIAGGIGLSAAIEYLNRIGMENVRKHEREITNYTLRKIEDDLSKVKIYGPRKPSVRGGIISFNVEGVGPHETALMLDEHGIAVRSGFHCTQPLHECKQVNAREGSVRASFYIYNTKEEVDKFINVMKKIEGIT